MDNFNFHFYILLSWALCKIQHELSHCIVSYHERDDIVSKHRHWLESSFNPRGMLVYLNARWP